MNLAERLKQINIEEKRQAIIDSEAKAIEQKKREIIEVHKSHHDTIKKHLENSFIKLRNDGVLEDSFSGCIVCQSEYWPDDGSPKEWFPTSFKVGTRQEIKKNSLRNALKYYYCDETSVFQFSSEKLTSFEEHYTVDEILEIIDSFGFKSVEYEHITCKCKDYAGIFKKKCLFFEIEV